MTRKKFKKQLFFLYLSLSSVFLLFIGGVTVIYNDLSETVNGLNKTIDEYEQKQKTLIEANKSLQTELEQLKSTENIEATNAQLNSLAQENEQLKQQYGQLDKTYQETLAINEQYASERDLSVIELETKYRTLSDEAQKLKNDYESMNAQFYIDNDLKIKVMEEKTDNQHYWVAEVIASKNKPLSAEFASGTYGGQREAVSTIATRQNAVLAINASGFYTDTNKPMGSLARDGVFLQNDDNHTYEVLTTTWSGDLAFHRFNKMEDLLAYNINDSFAFGPILIRDSQLEPLKSDDKRAPRTAIGQLGYNHYVIVVADGRQEGADGLTLAELQTIFQNVGATQAYNLDGGGSSTLFFNGKILNNPSEGKERLVTDIIYF